MEVGELSDFILDDEYINEMITFFDNTSEKAEMQLNELIERLQAVCEFGIMEGNKAEYLKIFTERTAALKGLVREYGEASVKLLEEFLADIDKADSVERRVLG